MIWGLEYYLFSISTLNWRASEPFQLLKKPTTIKLDLLSFNPESTLDFQDAQVSQFQERNWCHYQLRFNMKKHSETSELH